MSNIIIPTKKSQAKPHCRAVIRLNNSQPAGGLVYTFQKNLRLIYSTSSNDMHAHEVVGVHSLVTQYPEHTVSRRTVPPRHVAYSPPLSRYHTNCRRSSDPHLFPQQPRLLPGHCINSCSPQLFSTFFHGQQRDVPRTINNVNTYYNLYKGTICTQNHLLITGACYSSVWAIVRMNTTM